MKHRPIRVLCHGRQTIKLARQYGWLPGARYTNLRDIRGFDEIGLIDIDWKEYNFQRHLDAVKAARPMLTIARDVERRRDLRRTLDQANELKEWCRWVVVVPKDPKMAEGLTELVPDSFLLGYSVPTRYGSTPISINSFGSRPVHLLGGRPDAQLRLSRLMNVHSFDGNRFTLDATFGDYFDGQIFRPHPLGGYFECITSSLKIINRLWRRYECDGRCERKRQRRKIL